MYEYEELYEKATANTATAEDRVEFFKWLKNYDMSAWNGEEFLLGKGKSMRPVYNEILDEDGEIYDLELIDAVID